MGVEKKDDEQPIIEEQSNSGENEDQMEEIEYSQPIECYSPQHQDNQDEINNDDQEIQDESESVFSNHQPPPEMEQKQSVIQLYQLGEHVDCLDSVGKWCNAEIVAKKGDMVKVHFTGWGSKYDEWINMLSERIITQWKRGQQLRLYNRLDVRDEKGKWYEANIIDINDQQMRIHYKGFSAKFDETIQVHDELIDNKYAEVGTYTNGFGQAKFANTLRYNNDQQLKEQIKDKSQNEIELIKKRIADIKEKENNFRRVMAFKQFRIKEIEGDGNCMFRAISDQIYNGNQDYHDLIRQACMDYIENEKDFFVQFIIGGEETFDEYVIKKRLDGVWGDDIELQAMSEIYNRPIEIYAYRAEPLRTFHEEQHKGIEPIRLSYHGGEHYNSIVRFEDRKEEEKNETNLSQPGQLEERALQMSRFRKLKKSNDSQINTGISTYLDIDEIVHRSRQEFETNGKRDMEVALAESLLIYEKEIKDQEKKLIDQTSDDHFEEEQIIQMALKESMDQPNGNQWQSQSNENEEEMLRRAIELSKSNGDHQNQFENNQMTQNMDKDQSYEDVINLALEYGFDAEQAVEAISIVGSTNAEMVINYLMSLQYA